jgi:hypothetical protein
MFAARKEIRKRDTNGCFEIWKDLVDGPRRIIDIKIGSNKKFIDREGK